MIERSGGMKPRTIQPLLLWGMLGTILLATGDWLMIYGDTTAEGNLAWLTVGVAQIPAWRNAAAMVVAFPAIICYAVALYGIRHVLLEEKQRTVYTALTAVGMLPWLCLHLFYTMLLYLFAWMNAQGETTLAHAACEALVGQLGWLIPVSEVLMLLPFFYLFYVFVRGNTCYKRVMALNNPLIWYVVLKSITMLLPDAPFRLAFTNGLMSEAMFIWFLLLLIFHPKEHTLA